MRAKDIFMDAIELPHGARTAFIREACGDDSSVKQRVDALLSAHDDANSMLGDANDHAVKYEDELEAGRSIHNYRLVEEIGLGGFGSVWLAEQERPLKRLVAIKVLKLGMDSSEVVARFEAEKQALALMDHPAIAKVFDAGTTEKGRPFFAMELVDGLPISEYCEEQHLGTHERVKLVLQICEALTHAHQKGVIHRDIKPSNVLIAQKEGVATPKIIDFGIAKAIGGRLSQATIHTRVDQMIGTPGYMSPEQVSEAQDVDTRSDVYSVGALLYELLTGKPPLDISTANLATLHQQITSEEPVRPSTRLGGKSEITPHFRGLPQRDVRGDLDWIVMRCLEKDRDRRYDSMGFLAADLRRYLNDEVVSAGPPTIRYRTSNFVRRNLTALVVTGVMFAVLITATAVSTIQARKADLATAEAQASEADAKQELARSAAVAGFLERLLMSIDPAMAKGRDTEIIEDVLEIATNDVDEASQGLPSVEASLRRIIGGARFALGEFEEARNQLERALELNQEIDGEYSTESLMIALTLGPTIAEAGEFDRAKAMLTWCYAGFNERFGPDHPHTRLALSNLAAILTERGSPEELEPILRGLERAVSLDNGPDHEDSLRVRNNLAVLLSKIGQEAEAEELMESVLAAQMSKVGPEHPHTMATMNNLAGVYQEHGQLELAESMLRELLEIKLRVLPEGHPSLLIGMNNLARFLHDNDQDEESAIIRNQAIESAITHHGISNRYTLTLLVAEGFARQKSEEWDLAESAFKQVIAEAEAVFGKRSAIELSAINNLAQVFLDSGRAQEACDLVAPILDHLAPAFPESSDVHQVYPACYGIMLHAAGHVTEALPYLERGQVELAGHDHLKKWYDQITQTLHGIE